MELAQHFLRLFELADTQAHRMAGIPTKNKMVVRLVFKITYEVARIIDGSYSS